jgi:uncharacterized membrane protein
MLLLGIALVLITPGYAATAALFPSAVSTDDAYRSSSQGLHITERIVLSIGASVGIVGIYAILITRLPIQFDVLALLLTVGGTSACLLSIAVWRRHNQPPDNRYTGAVRQLQSHVSTHFVPTGKADKAATVFLVCCLVLTGAGIMYATTTPNSNDSYTEFYLLTEEPAGKLTAANYPTNFTQGASKSVVVGVSNNEFESIDYTVVTVLQRTERTNNKTAVTAQSTIGQYNMTLTHGAVNRTKVAVTPDITGERLRLTFLLYRGKVPANPGTASAYRQTHLWVSVTPKS